MDKQYFQLIKDIEIGRIFPYYFLHGDELFFHQKITDKLKKHFLESATPDNFFILTHEQLNLTKLHHLFSSATLFSDHKKLTVIQDFEKIKEPIKKVLYELMEKNKKKNDKVFILITDSTKPKMNALNKLIMGLSVKLNCRKVYDNKIPVYIKSFAAEFENSITEPASTLLKQKMGSDLFKLYNEIEKASLLNPNKKRIDKEDIQFLSGFGKDTDIYEFMDIIGSRQGNKTIEQTVNTLQTGDQELFLVNMLSRFFVSILSIKSLLHRRTNKNTIAKNLHIHPFFIDKYISFSQQYKINELEKIIYKLMELDFYFKGGKTIDTATLFLSFIENYIIKS